MKTNNRRLYTRLSCVLLACMNVTGGCGVEVGNPHGSKGGGSSGGSNGTVSVALADAPIDNLKNVYFNLKSLSVVSLAGVSIELNLATTGKVDALALQNGKSLSLATGQTLPAGDYAAAVLDLDEATPATVVDSSGGEAPLPFANGSHSIYVPQAFTVSEGGALDLVLHIDLRASLTQLTDAHGKHGFKFGPQASLLPKDVEASLTATVADTAVVEVCAYLQRGGDFNPGSRLPLGVPGGRRPSDGDDDRPPPPPDSAAQARAPHSFDHGQGIDFDETSTCANAFTSAAVVAGSFSMHHLWPGTYRLRFFKGDGTHTDAAASGVAITPGQAATNSF